MSSEPVSAASDAPDDVNVQCWCCDTRDAADRMVHLGNQPEVHLCLRCAHFVHQQARKIQDEGRPGPGTAARNRLREMRAEVIGRGWHQRRFTGGLLRWLGDHLP